MRKILHIVEAFGGGIITYLNDLTKGQSETYKVYIAHGLRYETPVDFKKIFDDRIVWIEIQNFKKPIGWHDLKAYKELQVLQDKLRPDIIHLHSSKAGAIGRILFCRRKDLFFYTPHGFSFLMGNSSLLRRTFYKAVEYLCANISSCITISCSKGEYQEAFKLNKNTTYVSNGISPTELNNYQKEKIDIKNPVICTIGRILPQKNPTFFNKVATLLPNLKFVWIGDGELKALLSSPNIIVTGWKSRTDALEELMNSDIFLLPSLWEGLPISLLEAMYLKKICIVSDVIGNRDVIQTGENGLIADTPEEFVEIIMNVLQERLNYKEIISKAHSDVIELYNSDLLAIKYDEKYNLFIK